MAWSCQDSVACHFACQLGRAFQLPVTYVMEEYKVTKLRLQCEYKDAVIRENALAVKTGRKWKMSDVISAVEGMVKQA